MKRARPLQPWLLLLTFFGPLLLAAVLYYGELDWPPATAAHGELIQPPVSLPPGFGTAASASGFGTERSAPPRAGRWSLIYARTAPCETRCLEDLNRLNQVRLALGKDLARTQLVFLHTGAPVPVPEGADLVLRRLDDRGGRAILALLGADRIAAGRIYVADPLGRLVIAYPPDAEQRGILEDVERLLAVSRIG